MAEHQILNEKSAVEYVKTVPGFFPSDRNLTCSEISDGNMNLVFRIQQEGSGKSVVLKQAIPYMRAVGDSWPLTVDRIRIEYETLKKQFELCPQFVPEIYHYNEKLAVMIMEDLSDYHILRKGLIARRRYPNLSEYIGSFLARTLLLTSDFVLDSRKKKQEETRFQNFEMCKLSEDFIFTFPYFDHEMNRMNPYLQCFVRDFREDEDLKNEVAKLKETFMTKKEALLHGDFHTGSLMVTEKETKVIDSEFAFYGPMGFDIGAIIANFLFSYVAEEVKEHEESRDYQAYLLDTISETWAHFEKEFRKLWRENVTDLMFSDSDYMEKFMMSLFHDSIGFAGCELIRRVIGTSHVEDLETIDDMQQRAQAETRALQIGRKLILKRHSMENMNQLPHC